MYKTFPGKRFLHYAKIVSWGVCGMMQLAEVRTAQLRQSIADCWFEFDCMFPNSDYLSLLLHCFAFPFQACTNMELAPFLVVVSRIDELDLS